MKTKVFLQLDNLLTEKMVAASSSSCLGPSQFAGGMQHRDRVVVVHPVCRALSGSVSVCLALQLKVVHPWVLLCL